VLITLFASYHWLGFIAGNSIADDAKWTAVFMANIHFAAIGTNYLAAQAPPSPLQNMWTLGVEEQFYLVWPTIFLLVASFGRKINLRLRIGLVLSLIMVLSFAWSIAETAQNPTWAYFSPLTRAWELALGGLIAVASPLIARVPASIANVAGGLGLGGVLLSGVIYTANTAYPGIAVALPVISTATVIAAGSVVATGVAEKVLALRPCLWMGKRSFSFYLWHWPILIVAYEEVGHALPVWQNVLWLFAALGATTVTYRFVENPIRFAKPLTRSARLSLLMGVVLIMTLLGVSQWLIHSHQ
jgi:peptidoglycan/LPS O-acetylase OafA/YrhL